MDSQDADSSSSFYPGFGRGKTGCITCRIRRKKCDEIRDDQNRCQECVRLNIPCAGWGEKRPDWARDDESLRIFKERIKRQSLNRPSSRTTRQSEDPSQSSSGGATANDTSDFDWALLDELAIKARSYGTPITRTTRTPEMFDFPGLGAQLLSIAQAIQLPTEYMVYATQAAELGNWKASQDANGTLSYRELARRGRAIEQALLGLTPATAGGVGELAAGTLAVPTVPSQSYAYAYDTSGHGISSSMSGAAYPVMTNISSHQQYISYPAATQSVIVLPQSSFAAAVAQTSPAQLIFVDACIHMLHSIVSGPNPRVPELATAARTIVTRFSTIPPNQRTPALIFPLCIAGILADSAEIHLVQARIGEINAPIEVTQVVMGLITSVQQSRWAHELGSASAGHNP